MKYQTDSVSVITVAAALTRPIIHNRESLPIVLRTSLYAAIAIIPITHAPTP